MLTYQGHAEFDGFVNSETLNVFGKPIWSEERLGEALKGCEGVDDAVWAAGVMLRFFLESEVGKNVEALDGYVEVAHEEEVMARL